MKIPVSCFCELHGGPVMPVLCPVNEDHTYTIVCDRGKTHTVIFQEDKCTLLFELSLYALADGYPREAVSSATSALERFYEYFLRVITHKNSTPQVGYAESWKKIKNQSERQLGAFVWTYLMTFGRAPRLLSEKDSAFRNSVIHKGMIPTRSEAIDYLNAVMGLMVADILLLKKEFRLSVDFVNKETYQSRLKKLGRTPDAMATRDMAISLHTITDYTHNKTIFQRLSEIEKYRNRNEG